MIKCHPLKPIGLGFEALQCRIITQRIRFTLAIEMRLFGIAIVDHVAAEKCQQVGLQCMKRPIPAGEGHCPTGINDTAKCVVGRDELVIFHDLTTMRVSGTTGEGKVLWINDVGPVVANTPGVVQCNDG